jgi:hypothetical protein
VAAGNLLNVSFVDPAFDTEGNGTSADDHPLADVRLCGRFIADTYHGTRPLIESTFGLPALTARCQRAAAVCGASQRAVGVAAIGRAMREDRST